MVALVDVVEFLLPDDRALLGVETEEMAHRAKRVDLSIINDRRGPRAIGVAQLDIGTIVRMMPDLLPGLDIETEDSLIARHRGLGEGVLQRWLVGLAVHDIEAIAHDRRAAVAGADRLPPADPWPTWRELFDNALLAPDRVALRAGPLRPVVAANGEL